jgi:hypothetical protein
MPGRERSVRAVGRPVRIGLLGLFLGLVADSGTARGADGATDDRAGRSGDRATREGACRGTAQGTRARTGLVVTFGRLTGDRTTDGADGATDDRAGRATDSHSDGCATEGAGTGTHGLGATFFVLRGRATVPWGWS